MRALSASRSAARPPSLRGIALQVGRGSTSRWRCEIGLFLFAATTAAAAASLRLRVALLENT
jgi:hypothetical protein